MADRPSFELARMALDGLGLEQHTCNPPCGRAQALMYLRDTLSNAEAALKSAEALRDNARHLSLTEAIEAFELEGQQLTAGAIRFYRDHGTIEHLVAVQRMAGQQ